MKKLLYQSFQMNSYRRSNVRQQNNAIQSYGSGIGLVDLLHPNLDRLAEQMSITPAGTQSKAFATQQVRHSQHADKAPLKPWILLKVEGEIETAHCRTDSAVA